jgi:hypothetical protein
MTDSSDAEIETIMIEAHELLRRRLNARGLEAVHIVFAVTPEGTGIVRTNAGPEVLRELAEVLRAIESYLQAPASGATTH